MIDLKNITVNLANFNGYRNQIGGKGRLEVTVKSLMRNAAEIAEMNLIITDNCSPDGSWEYVQKIPFGVKRQIQRIPAHPFWLSTTLNNMSLLKNVINNSDSEFIWHIENDSFFFREGFVTEALDVLEQNKDISLVHLRRWTDICAEDLPGVPTNLNRYEEVRTTSSGVRFYVLEKRPEYALWVPTEKAFRESFVPDEKPEYGKCPLGEKMIGSVRLTGDRYERLLTEHWNGYTTNGWIGRRSDLKQLVDYCQPIGERQMSRSFKKYFRSARLEKDSFVDFGWKARAKYSEGRVIEIFEKAKSHPSSIADFGSYKPKFEGVELDIPEDKMDIYAK
jgi:hypothetical protein